MLKVLMLKGLPASGKSTYARELQSGSEKWKRVNKDDLRAMLDNSKWSKSNEKFVLKIRDEIIYRALTEGINVVIDDTNFNPIHEAAFKQMAQNHQANFEVKFFDEDLEECIKRDLKRPHSVGERVIRQMYDQYLKPAPEVYTPPAGKPTAVIVDIDGTLAHMTDRGPYEWAKVGSDAVDPTIKRLVNWLSTSYKIILLSGRDSVCRPETEKWLRDNKITYDELHMREKGSMIKDSYVKRGMFEEHVRNKYQVEFILDDRQQVVDMWRSMGLKVMQVADGDF